MWYKHRDLEDYKKIEEKRYVIQEKAIKWNEIKSQMIICWWINENKMKNVNACFCAEVFGLIFSISNT